MYRIDSLGWSEAVCRLESPHWNARPEGVEIDTVILHNISLPPGEFLTGDIESLFLGTLDTKKDERLSDLEGFRVSSHYLISREGIVTQFVSCDARAWHAGVSVCLGRQNCNDFSIGIELEGTDFVDFEPCQYDALTRLLVAIAERYPLRYVVGHSDVAPTRKTDPGPHFDWGRLENVRDCFGSPEFVGAAAALVRSRNQASSGIVV